MGIQSRDWRKSYAADYVALWPLELQCWAKIMLQRIVVEEERGYSLQCCTFTEIARLRPANFEVILSRRK